MKVAILAGGRGTRLGSITENRPKPLVEVGGRPILWHILMHYAAYGFTEFVIALGYKGAMIRQYVERLAFRQDHPEWTVTSVGTGPSTQTGGRIKRLAPHLGAAPFLLTWSDIVADVNLDALVAFHRAHGQPATLTAVHPPPRFGHLTLHGDRVTAFAEKPEDPDRWINGAYFVLEPEVFDRIEGDATSWERDVMPGLAAEGRLMAYRHTGFWQCMDTPAEQRRLERLWQTGNAPWITWTPPHARTPDRT